ncbi:Protoheme IX farnesyltransferase [Granulibacter bethesdensis]|nr:Protoheme IX farnesyltransferase [Granulibacter bethesdensis]
MTRGSLGTDERRMSDSAFVNGGREVSSLPLSAQMPGMASAADWVTLLKPRVMSLVVFTGLIGMLVAPGSLHPVLGAIAILCIAVATGASGAINMWYDRDIDAVMRRTKNRPIPAGRIEPGEALGYGIVLAVGSVLVMWLATNVVAAAVLAFAIFFYSVIYTMWLKRSTPQNIVIGGAAGAFPPVIGWAAVTGTIDLMPLMMFAIVFFWTPPHFWSLSLWAQMDYERAGVPMLPVVAGARKTRQHIMAYTVLLSVIAVLPWALGDTGRIYGLAAIVLSIGFLVQSWRVLRDKQDEAGLSLTKDAPARAAFKYSLIYLAVLFLALAVDRFV